MASVNKVILIGHLGKDPEIRYTNNGTAVASFSIATTRRYKDSNDETKEETEWHRITTWSRLAEIASEYLHKGSLVYVEGRLTTRKWQDKEGQDRYTTEIVAESMQFLDKKPSEGERPKKPAAKPAATKSAPVEDDDDIPF